MSLVVGICAARHERVYRWSLGVSGLLYTIPTLAFLALLIPVVGLGRTNAIICMVAFSLMIMIRNVATGIREVPARRRRGGEGHGDERAARSCAGSSCRSRCRSSSPGCGSRPSP